MPNPGYLKNYRPVLYYFRDAYGLSVNEIEFLFHVYDMTYFNYTYVVKTLEPQIDLLLSKFLG